MTSYLLIIRDSDGAILGSQRGVNSFSGQNPDRDMGPFGDTPFAAATRLKAGYSAQRVTVEPPDKPPRSPAMYWDGSALVPSSEAFRATWLDAAEPQRVRDRLRAEVIATIRSNPTAPVSADMILTLIGELES
jgi:hypothetical protein